MSNQMTRQLVYLGQRNIVYKSILLDRLYELGREHGRLLEAKIVFLGRRDSFSYQCMIEALGMTGARRLYSCCVIFDMVSRYGKKQSCGIKSFLIREFSFSCICLCHFTANRGEQATVDDRSR